MKWQSIHHFGHDALGPVVNAFMARLHAYLRQCDDHDHKVLFALRAGLRIQDLYQIWLAARNITPPANMVLLKASRMMAIKAAYGTVPTLAVTALGRELSGTPLNDVIRSVLNCEITAGRCPDLSGIPQAPLHEFLQQDDQVAQLVRRHLTEQSELYSAYLSCMAGDAKRLILVDSGWRGTTQLLLEAAFPDYQWQGIYLGCIGRAEILGHRPGPMHGLIFDSQVYIEEKPETAFLVHRHLIESLFEPGIPSVEQIEEGDVAGAQPRFGDLARNELSEDWDNAFEGVRAYIAAHGADPLSKIAADYHIAIGRLAEIICYPEADDVLFAAGKRRSFDLGRAGEVTSVMPAKDRFEGDCPDLRVEQSIWQTGQVALEFTGERARTRQKKLVLGAMGPDSGSYFVAPTDAAAPWNEPDAGHVAVITRTKDRPLLLKRAAESVAAQTYDNYTWVIVNDGGSLEDVQEVLRGSLIDPTKVTICSNAKSLGMEAASNIGIRCSKSEYVVIHDDDDSWHPDFLKDTVRFLEQNHSVYGGVITRTLYVSEEIRDQSIIEHGRWPYHDWVGTVQLSEMVIGNFFAPIAFLFRRDIWEKLGGFDEKLPVLGDWDFNIRFLMKTDIGVLPKALAYYHHRDQGASASAYSNSVIGGTSRHNEYNAIVRNKYIRLAATNSEYASLAVLMGTAFAQADTRNRLDSAKQQLASGCGNTTINPQSQETGIAPQQLSNLQQQLSDAQRRAEMLQAELDKRWVMLHMAASKLLRATNLNTSAKELVWKMSELAGEYARVAKLEAPPDFDEDLYMKSYHDVLESVSQGQLFGAFDHYIKHGMKEGRLRPLRV